MGKARWSWNEVVPVDSVVFMSLLRRVIGLSLLLLGCFLLAESVWFSQHGGSAVHASSRKGREAGATLFHVKGCEHCHGVDGVGTDKGPDLTTIGKRWKRTQIEQQVIHGGNGMPAFGEVLLPDETKSLLDYLSAKKKAPKQQGANHGAD